jgi:hypothetical protein
MAPHLRSLTLQWGVTAGDLVDLVDTLPALTTLELHG